MPSEPVFEYLKAIIEINIIPILSKAYFWKPLKSYFLLA